MKKHQINMVPVEKLIPYVNNARKHSEQQVSQIAASIKEFGFVNPILIDAENVLIAGHGRLAAAHKLGLKEVPCLRVEHLTEAQKRAYILADNRLAELAEWDKELINLELTQLKDLDFNFELTGFDQDFVDEIQPIKEGLTDEDAVPEVDEEKIPVSKRGMTWLLGKHRLRCGDSTDENDVAALMNGEKVDLVHTDPPYNVAYDNQNRPKAGKNKLGSIKNDEMDDEKFFAFLQKAFLNSFNFSKNDSSIYIWYASKETLNFHAAAAAAAGWQINQQIIWKKPMLLGRGKYQWAHEPCVFGTRGSPFFTDDRTKTTVWDFGGYDKSKNVHPTQKPIFIPEEAILNSSKINDCVLDLFGGSGSTLIACEKTNRRCYMMELDEKYCDVIVKRWQEFAGQKAILEGTDKTFDDLATEQ